MSTNNWKKYVIPALTFSVLLVATAIAFASGGGEGAGITGEGGSLSHAKQMDFLWRVLNFTGLVIILVWALKKPLVNTLGSRRQAIKDQFEELDARKAEAEQKYKEYDAKLASIDSEVSSIIGAAVALGEAEKQRIIKDAERAAGDIKRQAEMAIQQELAQAKRQLREEVAEQAAAMAEEILRKNLQEADQSRLVEDYLEKVGALQ
ncbi:MAG: ATP synthase F0 subunit B [Proteobacteria bacterium]|nr:ATP synthase F0 subunit B [Pseudomonadota bacterium]MBU1709869.1 ATP synthase F0 subunit B [Pseudomonadota bacterium]